MDELRQTTGAKIDVPNARDVKDSSGKVEIQIKGTKSQVAQAKKILEEKKTIFDETIQKTLEVDKKHHRALIGAGGKIVAHYLHTLANSNQAPHFATLLSRQVALMIAENSREQSNSPKQNQTAI
jgi:hypothetical protein